MNVFEDDEAPNFRLAYFVNCDGVGMVECGSRARLLLEAPDAGGVFGETGRQDFDRDLAVKPRVFREIDFSHPARADLGNDSIVREGFAEHSALGVIPPSWNHR